MDAFHRFKRWHRAMAALDGSRRWNRVCDAMAIDSREMMEEMDQVNIRRRDRLKKHYTTVSNVIIFGYRGLTDSEKLTYQAIDSFDWSDGEGLRKGYAYPSLRTLARLRGLDERTLRRHLSALEEAGLLRRELRVGQPSLLWIEEPSEQESEAYLSTIAIGPDTDVRGTPDTDVRPNKKEESEKDKTVNGEQSSWKGRGQRLSADEFAKRGWLTGEILNTCRDRASLAFYRKIAATVPEQRIFEALSVVRAAAREGTIRTTRGALFTSVIQTSGLDTTPRS
jgi:hypothetical protein